MVGQEIIVVGANGNCVDIAELVTLCSRKDSKTEMIGFLDDNPRIQGSIIAGHKVLGGLADARKFPNALFINGIGSVGTYYKKADLILSTGIPNNRWKTLVSPLAFVSPSAKLGNGVVVFPSSSICSNATIGSHVLILCASVVSHDAVIGDFCCIASGVCISGGCVIEQGCYLGSNSVIKEGVRIEEGALVGMGSVVTKNVSAGMRVAGNPAKPI